MTAVLPVAAFGDNRVRFNCITFSFPRHAFHSIDLINGYLKLFLLFAHLLIFYIATPLF